MNLRLAIPLLLACWSASCSSNPHFMTPGITQALHESELGFPIRNVSANTYWSHSFAHGLQVEVRTTKNASDYARDFRLEQEGAAKLCAALAKSDVATRWNFLEIIYDIDYGPIPPRTRNVTSSFVALIICDDLRMLRAKNAPPSAYQAHWKYVDGFKDQPDSKDLLRWPPPGQPAD